MRTIIALLVDNPHLGRFDSNLLSDQSLMEMLVESFSEETKEEYQDTNGIFLDVCQWEGVECDTDQNVISVAGFRCHGPIALDFIPPKVTLFKMMLGGLCGTLSTSTIPKGMIDFYVNSNRFSGTVDFTTLPECMQQLSLQYNEFTGSADFRHLPIALEKLYLQKNMFSGSLHLRGLPPKLYYTNVSSNLFSGVFYIENVPKSLFLLAADDNCFDEVAVVPSNFGKVLLRGSGVTSVVDEFGRAHPEERRIMDSKN